jgi:hypothetical protein
MLPGTSAGRATVTHLGDSDVDDAQAARFREVMARMGLRGPGGMDLTPDQALEIKRLLAMPLQAAQPDPDLGNSPLFAAAVGMHEFFRNLVAAGFTEDQALKYLSMLGQRPPQ